MERNIVTLLTTWNRPTLLKQALPHIEREAATLGPLVVVDNGSDDPETLAILEEVKPRLGSFLTHPRSKMKLNAHWHCGDCAEAAFNHVLTAYSDATHILKCDDDIVAVEGAWRAIVKAWDDAEEGGFKIAASTGIQTKNEPVIYERENYNILRTPCAAACLYEARDMKILFGGSIHPANLRRSGWDWSFSDVHCRKRKPDHWFSATKPSVVFHAGFTGTHSSNQDYNLNYKGSVHDVKTM